MRNFMRIDAFSVSSESEKAFAGSAARRWFVPPRELPYF